MVLQVVMVLLELAVRLVLADQAELVVLQELAVALVRAVQLAHLDRVVHQEPLL